MPKALKIGNAIVCEHIAAGSGNRPILINVYSGDILVSELPASLFLSFFIEMTCVPAHIHGATLEVRLDKKKIVEFKVQMGGDEDVKTGVISIPAGLVRVEGESDLSVWIVAPNFKPTLAVRKHISVGPVG